MQGYTYQTQWTSPNFTPNSQVAATWGRPRTIDAIAIHWWGDPNLNPTIDGVIATLCNPARQASAHFVATGTGRRVAQLVNFDDASWATNSANPYTISIECDPRGRDEDYEVVASVIAQIWDAYGYKPLVPHRQFVATACPGTYDLARLEALAKTIDGSGDWGDVKLKNAPNPPAPVDDFYRLFVDGVQKAAYSQEKNAYDGWVSYGKTGVITYHDADVTSYIVGKYTQVVPEPQPEPVPDPIPTPDPDPTPDPTPEPEPEPTPDPNPPTTLWEDIVKLFNLFVNWLKQYKRSK